MTPTQITTWYMLAREAGLTASVAVMPITCPTSTEAEMVARDWLGAYEHGFTQAVIALTAPESAASINHLIDTYGPTLWLIDNSTEDTESLARPLEIPAAWIEGPLGDFGGDWVEDGPLVSGADFYCPDCNRFTDHGEGNCPVMI